MLMKNKAVIIDGKKLPRTILPYNWHELGEIRNVVDEAQSNFCNTSIYQILPLKYLIKVLLNKKMRFNNILKSWEDPYELFFLKQNISVEGKSIASILSEQCKNLYGQCWSLNEDSDAMWRIYSSDKEGVRIKTSIIKMIQVLDQTRGMQFVGSYFGRVEYKNKNSILEWMEQKLKEGNGKLFRALTDSLFIKRLEFSHENEVRFIIDNSNSESYDNIYDDHIDMKVDPFDFIEEIALDPRLDEADFKDLKFLLSKIAKDIPIHKSDLYSFSSEQYNISHTPLHI